MRAALLVKDTVVLGAFLLAAWRTWYANVRRGGFGYVAWRVAVLFTGAMLLLTFAEQMRH